MSKKKKRHLTAFLSISLLPATQQYRFLTLVVEITRLGLLLELELLEIPQVTDELSW